MIFLTLMRSASSSALLSAGSARIDMASREPRVYPVLDCSVVYSLTLGRVKLP